MRNPKPRKFPVTVTEGGVSAKIRRMTQIKDRKPFIMYIADYVLLGERKQVWRADFEEERQVAVNASLQIAGGEQISLTLANDDRLRYLRAAELLSPFNVPLDVAAQECVSALQILDGRATIIEACRDPSQTGTGSVDAVQCLKGCQLLIDQFTAAQFLQRRPRNNQVTFLRIRTGVTDHTQHKKNSSTPTPP
jgi:hypothetical protein